MGKKSKKLKKKLKKLASQCCGCVVGGGQGIVLGPCCGFQMGLIAAIRDFENASLWKIITYKPITGAVNIFLTVAVGSVCGPVGGVNIGFQLKFVRSLTGVYKIMAEPHYVFGLDYPTTIEKEVVFSVSESERLNSNHRFFQQQPSQSSHTSILDHVDPQSRPHVASIVAINRKDEEERQNISNRR